MPAPKRQNVDRGPELEDPEPHLISNHPAVDLPDASVVLKYVHQLGLIDGRMKALAGDRKRLRKLARADGIALKVLDEAIRDADMSVDELREKYSHRKAYMEMLRAPIGLQLNLPLAAPVDPLDPESPAMPEPGAATNAGFRSAILGAEITACPHNAASEAGQAWIAGYYQGRERLAHESVDPLDDEDDDHDDRETEHYDDDDQDDGA